MSAILIYVTCENEKEASKIAQKLVSSDIVACANIIPHTKAVFKWEGSIYEQSEAILILKSQTARSKEIIEEIKAVHSYDLPCILSLKIKDGNTEFLQWILNNSKAVK